MVRNPRVFLQSVFFITAPRELREMVPAPPMLAFSLNGKAEKFVPPGISVKTCCDFSKLKDKLENFPRYKKEGASVITVL